tara:strand:- start:194 stop:667 length:474 start_codon:yes stop_codon:yes gene_type:complete
MSLDMLDNMLIVNPPPIAENLDQQSDNRSNILDLSELDIDYLKNNDLEKDNLSGTELDVQTIDANFLQDYLSDPLTGLRETRDGVSIEGTTFGFNAETQIYTILSGVSLRFIRSVNNNQDITVPKDQGTTLIINDAGKATTLIVNDGGSIIIVNQKN